MKKLNPVFLSLITGAFALSLSPVQGAPTAITDDGATAPTITSPSVGAFFGYNDFDYDAGNGFTDIAAPGQTFLTPNAAPSYHLDSITLQESNGSAFNASNQTFILDVFSVSTSTLTSLGTEEFSFNGTAAGDGGYFTLDTSALNLTLNGNTEYAFSLSNGSAPDYPNYMGLVSSAYGDTTTGQDSYSNGVAISGAEPLSAGGTESFSTPTVNNATYDRAFAVNLSVPEPTTWAMMIGGVLVLLGVMRFRPLSS
jgi:hypothetical protein